MNTQEIFDKVSNHLLTQGVRSAEEDTGICLYRGPNGTSCAVGCLISDKAYTRDLEGLNVEEPYIMEALYASGVEVDEDAVDLLNELQLLHDDAVKGPDTWKGGLRAIAYDFGLKVNFE